MSRWGPPPARWLSRRHLLGWGVASVTLPWLPACQKPSAPVQLEGAWVGAQVDRGHRLRAARTGSWPSAGVQRQVHTLVIGAGIAGLAAARGFVGQGIDDVHLLDLEDEAGGNSRGHQMGGMACPLGAHYLPLPGPQAHEVTELLFDLGLLRHELGRTVPNERHLCHSPQERLWVDGAWHEGLLPPAGASSSTAQQYQRFSQAVAQAQGLGFAIPTHRAAWTAAHDALDAITFDTWLNREGFDDPRLRWYLNYSCLDDYGAGSAVVSAWAGLHYFASRHGFQWSPPNANSTHSAERDPVFTWPEGNAWLARQLAAPHQARLHTGRVVMKVDATAQGVTALAWDAKTDRIEAWQAKQAVLAVPLFIAQRLLQNAPSSLTDALQALVPRMRHAPWLVANLQLRGPLLDRAGAPLSWDNVAYSGGVAGADTTALGYVNAMHQNTRPHAGPTVLTAYHALPVSERQALYTQPWQHWAERVLHQLRPLHPDLPQQLERIDLMRWGHAMSTPVPGVRSHAALATLSPWHGRLRLAHADLSAYSVFEEAFTQGMQAARPAA